MSRTFVLGRDCVVYIQPQEYRIPNPPANPLNDWLLVGNNRQTIFPVPEISDLAVNLNATMLDATTRLNLLNRLQAVIGNNGSISLSLLWQPGSVIAQQLLYMFTTSCPLAFAITDGGVNLRTGLAINQRCGDDVLTGQALWADFAVSSYDWNQPLRGPVTLDVALEFATGLLIPELTTYTPASPP